MRKLFYLGLIALAGIIIGLAWAEQITLTTYYPAPYGVYREFTTTGNTYLATNEGNVGIGTTSPSQKLDVSGQIHASGDICTDAGGGKCLSTGGGGGGGGGIGLPPLTFEVYNPDSTTYACVEQDLEEYCGDADGCTIKLLMQHETDGNDHVRIIDEHIYMEQTSLSNNNGAGIYGWTRQGGGGDYSWITGTASRYDIFNPWSWVWAKNYRHDLCPGQVGNGPAYTDPYIFNFMSHPHVRTTVIVYDSLSL